MDKKVGSSVHGSNIQLILIIEKQLNHQILLFLSFKDYKLAFDASIKALVIAYHSLPNTNLKAFAKKKTFSNESKEPALKIRRAVINFYNNSKSKINRNHSQ